MEVSRSSGRELARTHGSQSEGRPRNEGSVYPDPGVPKPRRGLGRSLARGVRTTFQGLLLVVAVACASLNLYSEADDVRLGEEAYSQVLAGSRLITSGPQSDMVQRAMRRIAEQTQYADSFPWEVVLIDDPNTANAFCLPGGKMAVYSGILTLCEDENALAVVMGHEVAHATLRHGTQRLTRYGLAEIGFSTVEEYLGAGGEYKDLAGMALELTLHLPFGREDELDADRVGLMYAARAGYDPRAAVPFWERMSQLGGGGTPEWLSTHPSGASRIAQLEQIMPEALDHYRQATGQNP